MLTYFLLLLIALSVDLFPRHTVILSLIFSRGVLKQFLYSVKMLQLAKGRKI
jgi:hypothetical protein